MTIIREGIRICGRHYRVEAFIEARPDSTSGACSGWGHGEHCCAFPNNPRCALCAGGHRTDAHQPTVEGCKAGRGTLARKMPKLSGPARGKVGPVPEEERREAMDRAKNWRGKAAME